MLQYGRSFVIALKPKSYYEYRTQNETETGEKGRVPTPVHSGERTASGARMLYKREAAGVRPPHQAGNQVQLRNVQQYAE
jgi:hypothetical protein